MVRLQAPNFSHKKSLRESFNSKMVRLQAVQKIYVKI